MPHVIRNVLKFAYRSLRAKDRFVEGSHVSPYEDFYRKLADSVSAQPQKKIDANVTNSEVEAFYLGRTSEDEFVSMVESKVLSKVNPSSLSPLNSLVWEVVTSVPAHSSLTARISKESGQKLWEMFMRLDIEGQQRLHIDDIADLVMRIFRANGHNESEENIKEWFCGEVYIDFWSFFSALVENYNHFLQAAVIQDLHKCVTLEVLKTGKMMKKGHVVPNWKERWFVLTPSALSYYESQDSKVQKGTITITAHSQVHPMTEIKGHSFRFKVIDGTNAVTTEISSPDYKTMNEWISTLRMAIRMHKVDGRNFLDRLRLAHEKEWTTSPGFTQSERKHVPRQTSSPEMADIPEKGITVSAHRKLVQTKSVPFDPSPRRPLPSLPPNVFRNTDKTSLPTFDNPPPPIPPQRFRPVDDMSAVHMRSKRPQGGRESLRRHSSVEGSSVEGFRVEDLHFQQRLNFKKASVPDHVMNLISESGRQPPKGQRSPPNGHRSPQGQSSPNGHRLPLGQRSPNGHRSPQGQMSPNGRGSPLGQVGARSPLGQKSPILPPKQISLDTALDTKQKNQKPSNGSPKPRRRGEYIQIQFAQESPAVPEADASPPLPRDPKTKFPYSTVVFEKEPEKDREKVQNVKILDPERDVEKAQNLKRKKPPPQIPPKYDSSESSKKGMKKFVSDSHMTEFPRNLPPSKPNSLPDLINEGEYEIVALLSRSPAPRSTVPETQILSEQSPTQQQNGTRDTKDEPPYVNVPRRGAPQPKPRALPRKGLVSDNAPPVPARKAS